MGRRLNGNTLKISDQLSIPMSELRFRFARSSGPGGQKVNRTATRVELLFDVQHSHSLTSGQRALILNRLRNTIDSEGVLHLSSQITASQWRNRKEVIARFRTLVDQSLRVYRQRIPTRATRAAREKRLKSKRRRSLIKGQRQRVTPEE